MKPELQGQFSSAELCYLNRAPELLMGMENYTDKIDLWGGEPITLFPPTLNAVEIYQLPSNRPLMTKEILLGSRYILNDKEVCAVGCIMGELLKHAPLFPGRTEIAMLDLFTKLLGSPHDIWKVRFHHAYPAW